MGKKWCYCQSDIFEKLMNEDNCPLGHNYDMPNLEKKKAYTMQAYNQVISKIRSGKI
jgi:hypothetical protein